MGRSESAARRRRSPSRARNALIAIGVLALVAAAWFFMSPGADTVDPTAAGPGDSKAESASGAGASQDPVAPTENGPVETFEVFAPKDPFEPLVIAAATGTTNSGSRKDDDTGLDRTAGDGDLGGHTVMLVDAFAQGGRNRARVNVDGTVHTVDEGERFAENFELVSVQGGCVTLLFGDDQFTICEGEQILK